MWDRGRLTEIAPPGVSALATGLNRHGQVVGYLQGGGGAFSWSRGRWSELFGDGDHASGLDVNDRGDVLVERCPEFGTRYFSLWNDGRVTDFRDPDLEPRSNLVEVNDRRDAAGTARTSAIPERAITWRADGQPRFLEPRPVLSTAVAINEAGAVAGYRAASPAFDSTPALWFRGRARPLPGLGGQPTVIASGLGVAQQPNALNERGHVVGSSVTPGGERHAVLWRRGEAIDLGTLGGTVSEAYALNDRDQVVGYSATADGQVHAFLWDRGTMHDLGTPVGDVASFATDVNDQGQVIGYALDQNGRCALLWLTRLR